MFTIKVTKYIIQTIGREANYRKGRREERKKGGRGEGGKEREEGEKYVPQPP